MNVQQLTNKFVADLSIAVREEVLADLTAKLRGPGAVRVAESMSAPITPTLMQRAMKRVGKNKRRVGQKRTEAEIAAATARVHDRVQKAPGSSSEMLQRALGIAREDIDLPLRKLLAGKQIRKMGEKRSTKYFPTGAKSKKN